MQEMSKTSDKIKPKTIVYIKQCAKNKMQIFINSIKHFKFVLAAVLAEDCMLFTRVYDVLTDYPFLQLAGWSHACLNVMLTSREIRTRTQMKQRKDKQDPMKTTPHTTPVYDSMTEIRGKENNELSGNVACEHVIM